MAVKIQLRRGSAAQWTAANPILAAGEVGLELDTDKRKIGDGLNGWSDLPYDLTQSVADERYADKSDLGAKADTASLGTAAAADVGDFATAAQGEKAATAVQPVDLVVIENSIQSERLGQYRISAIGDSITAGKYGVPSPGFAYADPGSWFTWLCAYSGGRLVRMRNAGIPSNKLVDMSARLDADIIAHHPDICVILGGANDVATSTPTEVVGILENMADRLLAAGIRPVLCTLTPYTVGSATKFNAAIRALGLRRSITVLDLSSAAMDPATGGFLPGLSTDGLHPTVQGSAVIGKDAAMQWAYTTPRIVPLATHVNDNGNLIVNGVFSGDSNSDGLADGWAVSGPTGTWACQIIPDPTIQGNWQEMSKTAPGYRVIHQVIASGWEIGDKLRFSGRVDASDLGTNGSTSIRLGFTGGTVDSMRPVHTMDYALESPFIFSEAISVPQNTTGVYVRIGIEPDATATGTVRIAQFSLVNETKLGGSL